MRRRVSDAAMLRSPFEDRIVLPCHFEFSVTHPFLCKGILEDSA